MIRKLYLEPSSICNLSCKTCFRNNWFDETPGMMCEEVLFKVYNYINSDTYLESVMLAGMGEPLLHKKTPEIIKTVSSAGKKAELQTNAVLLNEKMCEVLIDSGLDTLWISLDTPHAESADSSFDEIIRAIKYFNSIRKERCSLGLAFVISDANAKQISSFAKELGSDKLNISGIIPGSAQKEICSLNTILGEDSRLHKNYCPFIEEEKCFIKWNGDVAPCMQLLHNSYTYLFEEKRKVYAFSFEISGTAPCRKYGARRNTVISAAESKILNFPIAHYATGVMTDWETRRIVCLTALPPAERACGRKTLQDVRKIQGG